MPYVAHRDLYTSKADSDVTGETYCVQDAREITVQLVGSPSTTTIQGSNDDGRDEAITNWSNITSVGEGLYAITPGFRWIRPLRSETTVVKLNVWMETG